MVDKRKCSKAIDKLNGLVEQVRESHFFRNDFVRKLDKCLQDRKLKQIVCYGLGSFHSGLEISSRYQLALLLALYQYCIGQQEEHAQNLSNVIKIYDPSFEEMDLKILRCFRKPMFHLIERNEYCAYRIDCHDFEDFHLIYMPHLDKYFYNNLLGTNWCHRSLGNLLVLGNSFKEMIDSEISFVNPQYLCYMKLLVTSFKSNIGKIKKGSRKRISSVQMDTMMGIDNNYQECLVEIPLDDSLFEHQDIFNSLSFHFVDMHWLSNNESTLEIHKIPNWEPCCHDQDISTEDIIDD